MLSVFDATMICEGVDSVDTEDEWIEAWQLLIDTGVCWELQGWFGRAANNLIKRGICLAPI